MSGRESPTEGESQAQSSGSQLPTGTLPEAFSTRRVDDNPESDEDDSFHTIRNLVNQVISDQSEPTPSTSNTQRQELNPQRMVNQIPLLRPPSFTGSRSTSPGREAVSRPDGHSLEPSAARSGTTRSGSGRRENRATPESRAVVLRTRIRIYLRKTQSFFNEEDDVSESLNNVDELMKAFVVFLEDWAILTALRLDARQTQSSDEILDDAINIENDIWEAQRYLRSLRRYLVQCMESFMAESTFERSGNDVVVPAPMNARVVTSQTRTAAAANPAATNTQVPAGPRDAAEPQWRTSTQISEQARGQSEESGGTRSEEPQISHIAQIPPPSQTPSLPATPQAATLSGQPAPGPIATVKNDNSTAEDPNNYLPKLSKNFKLPKFNGDPKEYRKFMDLFNTFVHERQIPVIQKMLLLHDALSGRAYHSVKHLSIRAENYDPMRLLLQELYGQTSMAEDDHLRELERILSSGGEINFDKLPNFVNLISQHILALITLGQSYITLTAAFANRILAKLTNETQRKFMDSYRVTQTSTQTCKLEALMTFLKAEALTTEALRSNQTSNRRQPPATTNRGDRAFGSFRQNSRPPPRSEFQRNRNQAHLPNKPAYSFKNTTNSFHVASSSFPNRTVPREPSRKQTTPCFFCEGDHPPFRCTAQLTYQEREERRLAANGCIRCLKRNHDVKNCKDGPKTKCRYCSGYHYAVMCPKAPKEPGTSKESQGRPHQAASANLGSGTEGSQVFLWTALTWAEVNGVKTQCRILIDPGSQATHITSSLVKRLKSTPIAHTDLTLATAGGQVVDIRNCGIHAVTLRSRHNSEHTLKLRAIELDCVTRSEFPVMKQDLGFTPVADHLPKSGEQFVDVLLGQDYFAKISFASAQSVNNAFIFDSMFGWVFGGSQGATAHESPLSRFCGFEIIQPAAALTPEPDGALIVEEKATARTTPSSSKAAQTTRDLQFLWQSEDVGFDDDRKEEDKEEEDLLNKALIAHFNKTTYRDDTGRYVLRLPFKPNIRSLGDNEKLSRSRLFSFLEKLKKVPLKLKAVDDEFKNYIDAGFAEEAEPKKPGQLAHYLPIQAVFKPNPTSPLGLRTRVVKDASARCSSSASLNEVLHCGMNLLPEINKVLLKFRQYKFVFTADIEKAFLQFRIADEDRTFLRFLWPLNISSDSTARIREFWATRLDFGLVCSPFLHCQGIRFHLQSALENNPNDTQFIREVINTFYMDDVIGGANTMREVKHRIQILSSIFNEGHFPLKKWSASSAEIGNFIQQISPVADPQITFGQADAKVLGVFWNQISDDLSAPTAKALKELSTETPSKRKLLRALAQIFDPLGIISPVVINSKILFQDLWKSKIGWDDPLQGELLDRYSAFSDLVRRASNLSLPRRMVFSNNNSGTRELVVFSDASLHAYGMVAYLREYEASNQPTISFILSKSKVAPIKPTTIHRLELLGALLAARMVRKIFEWTDFKIHSIRMFCDNSAVLGWVASEPEKWKPFVANRIRRIHQLIGEASWNFVRSADNPADIVSRGADISIEPNAELWFHGPQWLSLNNTKLESKLKSERTSHISEPDGFFDTVQHEQKRTVTTCVSTHPDAHNEKEKIFFENSFSCWMKSIRFWAFMIRLKNKAKSARIRVQNQEKSTARPREKSISIGPEEMIAARTDLIKLIQSSYFSEEVSSACVNLKSRSKLFQYNPFVDAEGIIRCRTRLERAPGLSDNQKHPIILPSEGLLSLLLIRYIHERKCFHFGGVSAVLHLLREEFLVIHARKLIRQVIRTCTTCKIFHNQAASLPIAPLPAFRLETTPPFFHTGCDFAGPFKYKKDSGERGKSYILLFTCAVTRAVNLQLTTDMSTVEVLGALQKFVNRYPTVKTITSDNGLSFQRAAKELKLIYEHITNGDIKRWLADSFIEWNFITPQAPWFGAFYERQVQSVKRPLRKVLGSAVPHFRDFEVLLSNIEAMINRRPITPVATEVDSVEALSPADLLFGYKGKTCFPLHSTKPNEASHADKIVFSRRWAYQQRILSAFWKRFQNEYISYLRSAHRNAPAPARPLKIGDICLLEDPSPNRAYWPLCRVISFRSNAKPEQARSCTIKTATGQIFDRPIKKLYPIETTHYN